MAPSKRARADSDDSADESAEQGPLDLTQSAPHISKQILRSLEGCNEHSQRAKKLVAAMRLVSRELAQRAVRSTADAEAAGATAALVFSGVSVPATCFEQIAMMAGCNSYGALRASHKALLSQLNSTPRLWRRALSAAPTAEMKPDAGKVSMKSLLAQLKAPRYASVDVVVLPARLKIGKTGLKSLGSVLPNLTALDFGFSGSNLHPVDQDLLQAAAELPKLTSLRCDMWRVTSWGVGNFARAMGARLLDLRVADDTITKHYVDDASVRMIAQHCPRLQRLSLVGNAHGCYYEEFRDNFTVAGLVALLDGACAAHLVRLDFYKKGQLPYAAAVELADRLERGALPKLMHVVWISIPWDAALSTGRARIEAWARANRPGFTLDTDSQGRTRFRNYQFFAQEN